LGLRPNVKPRATPGVLRAYLKIGAVVKFSNRDLTCDVAETNIKNLKENIMPMLINKLYSEKRVNPHKCGHWKEHLPLNTGQTVPNTDKTPRANGAGGF